MTEAELRSRVWDRLDEDAGSSSVRFPTATLTEYIYDGARFFIAKTGCQYATVGITSAAYIMLYDLPCDFIQVERVLWLSGGNYYPLEPTQPRSMDAERWRWQQMTDTRSRRYFIFAPRKIGLWPVPTDDDETYFVHYQRDVYTDNLSDVPVEDHTCIVDYVLARCLLSVGDARGMEHYAKFAENVKASRRRSSNLDKEWRMGRG